MAKLSKYLPAPVREGVLRLWRIPRTTAVKLGWYSKPDFLIIGAQKGGTTSLYHYLVQHPKIAPARRKEVHFFDLHYMKGLNWYWAHFPARARQRGLLTGEATPYYLFHPKVPQQVAQAVPDAKLIVLLRNPVERAYSHFAQMVEKGWETRSFQQAIDDELSLIQHGKSPLYHIDDPWKHAHHSYLSRGIYSEQLKRWFALYPPERFLILKSEDFFTDPAAAVNATLEFMGLAREGYSADSFPTYNPGRYESDMPPVIRAQLHDFFLPHNRTLHEIVPFGIEDWDQTVPDLQR